MTRTTPQLPIATCCVVNPEIEEPSTLPATQALRVLLLQVSTTMVPPACRAWATLLRCLRLLLLPLPLLLPPLMLLMWLVHPMLYAVVALPATTEPLAVCRCVQQLPVVLQHAVNMVTVQAGRHGT